jgi:ribosome production factor 1
MPPSGGGSSKKKRPRDSGGDGDGDDGGGGGGRRSSAPPAKKKLPTPASGGNPSAPTIGQLTSHIRNKQVRAELYGKLKRKKNKAKKQERQRRDQAEAKAAELGLAPPARKQQRTIENTRAPDATLVTQHDADGEVAEDEAADEFAAHFARDREPKVLLTTCYKPTREMYAFLAEMLSVLPRAEYYARGGFTLKQIVGFASERGYTDLLVFNESKMRAGRKVDAMLHVHLPGGPTARWRLSSLKLGRDIAGHACPNDHRPELVLNGFDTRLGRRLGRMFASLFHQDPHFVGRRAVTFHNQRDFVFFRHHRYVFEKKERRGAAAVAVLRDAAEREKKAAKRRGGAAEHGAAAARAAAQQPSKVVKARLQEIGPRFTLRLESLQRGTFDSRQGEFEWVKRSARDVAEDEAAAATAALAVGAEEKRLRRRAAAAEEGDEEEEFGEEEGDFGEDEAGGKKKSKLLKSQEDKKQKKRRAGDESKGKGDDGDDDGGPPVAVKRVTATKRRKFAL